MVSASLALMLYNTIVYYQDHNEVKEPEAEIKTGTILTGCTLRDIAGKESILPDKGRLLLAFLTTECGPCQRQTQPLNAAVKSGDYDKVIGIFFEPTNKVESFISSFKPEFVCLLDYRGDLNGKLNLTTFPQTVEIQNGEVVKVWLGVQEQFD